MQKPSSKSSHEDSLRRFKLTEPEARVYFWRASILAAIDREGKEVGGLYTTIFRHDFFAWLQWVNIEDPKEIDPQRRSKPFILWPKQKELASFLIDRYRQGKNPLVNKSREIGATWLAAAILYWLWWSEEKFSALAMSRKEDLVDSDTVDSIFGKLRTIHACMPAFMKPRVEDHYLILVNTENGSYIKGESTNSSAGRSGRYSVVLCDEWAHVDFHKQGRIMRGLESVSRSLWRVSTPNGKGDDFHAACTAADGGENLIVLDWKTDPRRTQEWFDDLVVDNGGKPLTWDDRAQEYSCSFSGVSGLRVWKADEQSLLYTDADLPLNARKNQPLVAMMDFGSGPSWTVCVFFIVRWERVGERLITRIWLDREMVWQRRSAGEIGPDIMTARQEYADAAWFSGDPAGRAADSMQESWESNLRNSGVPISCLPAEYNTPMLMDEMIRDVQRMLDSGNLKVHERCTVCREAIESWEYDLPAGLSLELVNRKLLKPKKNAWSHPGNCIQYGVGAILRMDPFQGKEIQELAEKMPKSAASEIVDLFDRALGTGFDVGGQW